MRDSNTPVQLDEQVSVILDDYGTLTVIYDDGDYSVEVPVSAADLYLHLEEYFQLHPGQMGPRCR